MTRPFDYPMRVGRGNVARGSVGDRLLFTGKPDDEGPSGASLPDVAAVHDYHTLTEAEIADLLREYREAGNHMTGEKCAAVRFVQHETEGKRGAKVRMPSISGTRQNRVIILAAGPDATARVRLWQPLPPHGDTKKVIDLHPGDLVQVGIYQFAEDPVEDLLNNREILFFNARDIIRVIRSRELDELYASIPAPTKATEGSNG